MKSIHFIVFISIMLLMNSCNYRTPSKIRFEKNVGIDLPDSLTIIQDRFEESGPDFGLYYEFQLDEKNCLEFIEKINKSNEWERTKNGWKFRKSDDGIIYSVFFSNDDCEIFYTEELI